MVSRPGLAENEFSFILNLRAASLFTFVIEQMSMLLGKLIKHSCRPIAGQDVDVVSKKGRLTRVAVVNQEQVYGWVWLNKGGCGKL
jgi:hypothetical protein